MWGTNALNASVASEGGLPPAMSKCVRRLQPALPAHRLDLSMSASRVPVGATAEAFRGASWSTDKAPPPWFLLLVPEPPPSRAAPAPSYLIAVFDTARRCFCPLCFVPPCAGLGSSVTFVTCFLQCFSSNLPTSLPRLLTLFVSLVLSAPSPPLPLTFVPPRPILPPQPSTTRGRF